MNVNAYQLVDYFAKANLISCSIHEKNPICTTCTTYYN